MTRGPVTKPGTGQRHLDRIARAWAAMGHGEYYVEGESVMFKDKPGKVTITAASEGPMLQEHDSDSLGYAMRHGLGIFRPPTTSAHHNEVSPCQLCGGVALGVPKAGIWRVHERCRVTQPHQRVILAARDLGLGDVPVAVARRVGDLVPRFDHVHREPVYLRDDNVQEPWHHVDKSRLREAIEEAEGAVALAGMALPCATGWCAWCGVEEHVAWMDHEHRWPDGSPAPLCGDCSVVYERRGGSPQFWDDQRLGLAQALTGVPPQIADTVPDGLVAYAETAEGGDGTPWSHLPAEAVEAFRWSSWMRFRGKYAPPEHRAEALRRIAERERKYAPVPVEDPYGFGTTP